MFEGVCAVLAVGFMIFYFFRKSSLPLPPGPTPLPVLGNVFDVPPSHQWLTYSRWSKTFGNIMHVNVLGQHLIIINSLEVARDLLDKRSFIYSDRPRFTMISDLMGWDWAIQFMSYGSRFKQYRTNVVAQLRKSVLSTYYPIQVREARHLARELHRSPKDFLHLIKHASGATMMSIIYGCEHGTKRDSYVELADTAIDRLILAGNVGTFLVDFIPALKYVPEWFPGAHFKRKAREWRKLSHDLINVPFNDVKHSLAEETAAPSMVAYMLSDDRLKNGQEDIIKATGGVLYLGGADTTLSALYSFILAMVLHPTVMHKAQKEIDSVTRGERLPDSSDRESLQYMDCLLLEIFRWVPTVPLSVPHCLSTNDHYRGYLIPKGSIVMVNVWSILHDEGTYPNPSHFDPERFMPDSSGSDVQPDPREVAFGFGRRACPGRHFAQDHLWIIYVTLLAVFDIRKPRNEDGVEVGLSDDFKVTSSMVSMPEAFACEFIPRSEHMVNLLYDGGNH